MPASPAPNTMMSAASVAGARVRSRSATRMCRPPSMAAPANIPAPVTVRGKAGSGATCAKLSKSSANPVLQKASAMAASSSRLPRWY